MLGVCVVLVSLLLMSMGAMKIGVARLSESRDVTYKAFNDATAGAPPQYTADATVTPIPGIESLRPTLPLRVSQPTDSTDVTVLTGNSRFNATVGATAAVISPSWTCNGYPVGQEDQQATLQWMQSYIDESHSNVNYPLGLAPAWPP